jgi:hypothetical protein
MANRRRQGADIGNRNIKKGFMNSAFNISALMRKRVRAADIRAVDSAVATAVFAMRETA